MRSSVPSNSKGRSHRGGSSAAADPSGWRAIGTGAENVHEAVDNLAYVDVALVAAAFGRRNQRFDMPPLGVGQIARIAQPAAVIASAVFVGPMTRRTRGFSLQQLIKELKPYIVGWRGYFGFCQTPRVLTNLEAWMRRRLRLYLWRQWRTRQNRFAELRRRGVAKFAAAVAAGSPTGLWRMSGHPAVQQALRNDYFEFARSPPIYAPAQA